MAENALLTPRDKQILRGEIDSSDYKNEEVYQNQLYKLRSRVKRRSDSLVEELQLLAENGNEDLVDNLFQSIERSHGHPSKKHLELRLERLEDKIDEIEQATEGLSAVRVELRELEERLQDA